MGTNEFRRVAPFFLVKDVVEAAEYYRDVLGFTFERYWGEPPSFVMVHRDQVTIMLSEHDDDGPFPNGTLTHHDDMWDAYVWVEDADRFAEEVRSKGAEIVAGPETTFYGMREVLIRDVNGYHLCFGSDAEE